MSFLYFKNDNPNLINTTYLDENDQEIQPAGRVFAQGNRGTSLSNIKIGVFKADFSHQLKEP
ncbi:MAG: hypothetical protein IPO07_06365 [Haliscomenobacter sp.]|nr:hypothetical protein [Haliscomenobacter sp.]MBK9488437.1 hypothetical protein [Haliscomenobacter sp.]